MNPSPISRGMFRQLQYQKTIDEIKGAMTKKVEFLLGKIEERSNRIQQLRETFGIDDVAYITLLQEALKNEKEGRAVVNYTTTRTSGGLWATGEGAPEKVIIGAGVVQNLLTETTLRDQEKADVAHLQMIVRNLRPIRTYDVAADRTEVTDEFTLTEAELEYLGF